MNRKIPLVPVLLALIVIATATAFYSYQRSDVSNEDAVVAVPEETAALIAKVGALIVLPEGETPTVATVSNPEKLSNQPFFVNAKEGDKVLVYTKARKVYLYNPTDNILVNVAPLSVDTETQATP